MRAGTDTGNSKWTEFQPWHPSASLLSVQPCWYPLGTGSQVFKVSKFLIALVKNGCWGSFHPHSALMAPQESQGAHRCLLDSQCGEGRDGRRKSQHLLDAELSHSVIHQDSDILHGHSDVPVRPAALIRPVLSTLTLWREKTSAGELWSLTSLGPAPRHAHGHEMCWIWTKLG